jgi:type IX secretion system PorP/SprF family membrane protein
MKKLLQLSLILFVTTHVSAQQDVLLSQYMFNHVVINPGYAGSKNYMMATALHRDQWVGWKGAPESNSFTIHGPLKDKNLGLGFNLMNDRIGVTNRTDAYGVFSYQLRVSNQFKLGLGLQGGVGYFSYKNSDLVYWESNDKVFEENSQTNLLPNFGTGAFLYSRKYYFGISVPHLLDYNTTKKFSVQSAANVPRQTRHYFAEAGMAITSNPDVVIKPSVLLKYVYNAPLQADFNINVLFAKTFWVGASYRTNDAIVGILELQLSPKFRIGYSYDFTLTDIQNYSSGSHEIMLGYDFGYDLLKIKSPRYF